MCMAIEKECKCGMETARLHHVNSILPFESIKEIFCSTCSQEVAFDAKTMIQDNGWIIEYDMEIVPLYAHKMGLNKESVTPERIFDEGYSAWQGFTPNDLLEANREKMEIAKVAKSDPSRYFRLIREWTIDRAKRLEEEGWRKARQAAAV